MIICNAGNRRLLFKLNYFCLFICKNSSPKSVLIYPALLSGFSPKLLSRTWLIVLTLIEPIDMGEASSVCFSSDHSAPGSAEESLPGPGSTTSHFPAVAGQSMIPRYNIPPRRASSGASPSGGTFCPKQGA